MLEIKQVKKILKNNSFKDVPTVASVVEVAKQVSTELCRVYRYSCGIESLEVKESKWSYNGIEQPNPKARGFFSSPDGQNGEFYYALRDVGFKHHFYMAPYHWGVRKDNIILTYTEGDIAVFEEPVGYTSPRG